MNSDKESPSVFPKNERVNAATINKIKSLGDYDGSELIALLDYYGADGLLEISQEQAERYYNEKLQKNNIK